MIGFGQSWIKTIGNFSSTGVSVIQTNDGGYLIAGDNNGEGYIIKSNPNGIEQWSNIFQAYGSGFNSLKQTQDDGYIVGGYIKLAWNSDYQPLLVKYNISGNEEWQKIYSEGEIACVNEATGGGYIVTGNFTIGGSSFEFFKTDQNGNIIVQISLTSNSNPNSIDQTNDGGYIIRSNNVLSSIIIKLDGFGNFLWDKTFTNLGGAFYGDRTVQETNDAGIVICGTKGINGEQNAILIKTDNNGNTIFEVNYLFNSLDYISDINSVQQTIDNGYIICGSYENSGGALLIKTDPNGIKQWEQIYLGGPNESIEESYSVQQTSDGGYIISAAGYDVNFNSRIFLIKTENNGNISSTLTIPINLNRKLQKTVDILGKKTKPQTNTPLIEIYDDGTVEKRIVIE